MPPPIVTVICLCHNQAQYVKDAVESVLNQSYSPVQLIIIDDASTDNSVEVIQQLVKQYPAIEFISLKQNLGNCKAFNQGLIRAKGNYLIDLAADDVLHPDRVEVGVKALEKACLPDKQAGNKYGVHFSDAELISESGELLGLHSARFPHATIPLGNIYKELISRYFICPPTVMFTREVINYLGGYDESLMYEDFDFWIRSSRKFKYVYDQNPLVKRRITKEALANRQFSFFSKHSGTTYKVCEKILALNTSKEEQQALAKRIRYEIKLNLRLLNFGIVVKYFFLWLKNRRISASSL